VSSISAVAVPVALLVVAVGLAVDTRLPVPRRLGPEPGVRAAPWASGQIPGPTAGSVTRVSRLRRRVRPPTDQEVADWCDALARRMRTGDSLAGALRTISAAPSIDTAVAPAVLALDRGAGAATAILAARHRSAGLDAAVAVIAACATLGGPAAEPLDRVAATMRRRVADAADRHAQSAQARLSALTLTVLPGVVLAVLAITSAAVRSSLGTTAGSLSVGLGAGLNLVGWWWMRTIIGTRP
jgi:Flp pilus assembly protein TadB